MKLNDLKQLYEIDDSQWLEETVKLINNHQLQELDLENLVEELENSGRERKNASGRGDQDVQTVEKFLNPQS